MQTLLRKAYPFRSYLRMPRPLLTRVLWSALPSGGADALPTEFRIFHRGVNESRKGPCIFDAEAARAVMRVYSRDGVDLVIDLEHDSHDEAACALRSDAKDARGWFRLALRSGELWAVGVRWAEDGASRLRAKKQRYISPAFFIDPKSKRVVELVDVALTSAPATYHALPLVAASKGIKMDPTKVKAALDALIAGNADECMVILKDLIAIAAGAAAEDQAPASEDALEGAPDPAAMLEAEELAKEVKKFCSRESAGECIAYLAQVRATLDKIEQDSARVELSARRELVGELVKLGAEVPATAWDGDSSQRNPVARLLSEPIDSLRGRVAQLRSVRKAAPTPTPPAASDTSDLSPEDQQRAAGMTPEVRSRFVALRRSRKGNS